MTHPYSDLPELAFWAPSVASRHMLDIEGLWSSPFPITPATKIVTYGSCFAQHFSRALIARGYRWLNAEPAPAALGEHVAKRFNYGTFSSRTGNIYTASLLRQWTEWAVGAAEPPEVYWEKDGRIFDPFRPSIEPNGFGSVAEMLKSRQTTIAAFGVSLRTCNLFVFTLGLTESWWDAELGCEYAVCPGTQAGRFDPSRHLFRNQSPDFVEENLTKAIELMRAARSGKMPVLLTVSPVPLAATATGKHVLVATIESKSILRAAAGQVAATLTDVSYFPSYEIISSPPFRGTFFEPNLRSVNRHGVDHVMRTFFSGVSSTDPVASVQKVAETVDAAVASTASTARSDPKKAPDDVECDEELLAAFGPGGAK